MFKEKNILRLFEGIALIIDDKVFDKSDTVYNICEQLEDLGLCLLKYDKLPNENLIKNFSNISFIMLDWKLQDNTSGLYMGSYDIEKDSKDMIIKFINNILRYTVCPIFLFSNEEENIIKQALIDAEVCKDDKRLEADIIVKSKSIFTEADKTSIGDFLVNWITNNPSRYLLKKWDYTYNKSRFDLFHYMYNLNPSWANIMWQNYQNDNANVSQEFIELILNNIISRMNPLLLDETIMNNEIGNVNSSELCKIIEGSIFIKFDQNSLDKSMTGDLYKSKDNKSYFLNIRPQCDLQHSNSQNEDDIELYCIEGNVVERTEKKKFKNVKYDEIKNEFREDVSYCICAFFDNGKILQFWFRKFKIFKLRELQEKTIKLGRLISPYITRIQQRFANYIQRLGLPTVPMKIINDNWERCK